MTDIVERLRQVARQMGYDKDYDPYGMVEAADHIDTLKARVAELEGALREVAEAHFDLSLHKQHDTLSHLKHNAQKALAKLDGADEKP